ncbi:MAG TPA: AtpZ/AtpI family protein [Pyrinomonadaceae bacterium]|nr:AtpZ/AtpI family protein [Pyrinomonadaceae bacterium]
MIKSLLDADEEPSPKKESAVTESNSNSLFSFAPNEQKTVETPVNEPPSIDDKQFEEMFADIERKAETEPNTADETNANAFQIPEESKFFAKPESFDERLNDLSSMSEEDLEKLLENEEETYKNLTDEPEVPLNETKTETNSWENLSSAEEKPNEEVNAPTILAFEPESQADTIRKSGLAYSAAIVLLASVVFMMLLGWFADLLLGSSPWGIVGGIVLGGIIGFIQFFRISSSIFKKEN